MKFPESWLREHVAVDADRDQLAAALTAIGLEVEALDEIGGRLRGVVVGEIVACEKHPEADRLKVCRVDTGDGAPLQIVCGAPNARVGLKAPLATMGAVLPGGLEIGATTLRGVESAGMLCSAKELGIDADASGLLELSADAPVGCPIHELLGLPDARFELKLTPNRADCFSLRGIAYDVAAALGTRTKSLDQPVVAAQSDARIAIELQAGADCPRYVGRVIDAVDADVTTPVWLSERLKRSGIRPVSFLVDVTQYVMLELGQPMHAFDADRLQGPVGVRRARSGESLQLLDGREVTLDDGFLLITDADRPVALAGIMGGADTRVTEASRRVFLESAHFAPAAIIGRARKLGMHTDASHRFERGVDPALPREALERATQLILQVAGGVPGPVLEASLPEHLAAPAAVRLRRARLARVLGTRIADGEVERILTALGMMVATDDDGWRVTPPSRRFDIAIEEDLIEEVARIHGYERIPTTAPTGEIRMAPLPETRITDGAVREQLAARDYFEAINFAFVDAALLAHWGLGGEVVALSNPLSNELGVMRPSLLPGLIEALRRNSARQQARVRLFELGRVFHPARKPPAGDAPIETPRIAAVACGSASAEQWSEKAREVDFHDVKGDLESLLALAGRVASVEFRTAGVGWLHPGRAAEVWLDGHLAGSVGHLHPRLLKALDLDQEVVVFEVDLAPVVRRDLPRATALSRFPSVRRDLAVVVPAEMPWSRLEGAVRGALGDLLTDLRVFDQYAGPGLEAGFKSVAMGLILQDVSRTLNDQDADQAMASALDALMRECGARRRG
jgi:phenylalanyl-tRNA synthetase beta chain